MAKTATVVKVEQWLLSVAKVYRLSAPVEWHDEVSEQRGLTDHVIVSARCFVMDTMGPEAIAWPCDEHGEFVPDRYRCELSVVRSSDHDDAVRELGFEVLPSDVRLPPAEPMTPEEVEAHNAAIAAMIEQQVQAMASLRQSLAELREAEARNPVVRVVN